MEHDTKRMANAIRALSMDAIQRANSGHPGMPLGMAEIAVAVWRNHLRHNPANPDWINRDRFVLSNGHGSMLQYALLHLTGYDLSIEDIKAFRTLHSKTPGHPELGYAPGVETTTGPLGQGIANAVGMAIAEQCLAAAFNRPGHAIVDHHTYVFVGDGCLMEGVSHEACSLAGTLGLGKLIVLYDDNGITIDGSTEGWFTDDTPARFRSYGWHVIDSVDGHDVAAVDRAVAAAKAETGRPTLICCKTVIGKGSPNKSNSPDCHGSPLGPEEIEATRKAIGWPYPAFEIPPDVAADWNMSAEGAEAEASWQTAFEGYRTEFPDLAAQFERRMAGGLPDDFDALAEEFIAGCDAEAATEPTRTTSRKAIAHFSPVLTEMIGGSADLAGSNQTLWDGMRPLGNGTGGNYIYYGVREFGMATIMNGMAAHGGMIPFGATYMAFSDYSRSAIRMAALMKLGVVFVFTHDSLAIGQDGPTHQPVEHLSSLRMIPQLDLWRPCDAVEAATAWTEALRNRQGPTLLALSRQAVPHQERDEKTIALIRRGGYVLRHETGPLEAIVIATGSEVGIAVEAASELAQQGIGVRVVSMPSTRRFDAQPESYRAEVLKPGVPIVSVEAGSTDWWARYTGPGGARVGIDSFGESAAPEVLFEHFGITSERVVETVRNVLGQ